MGSRALGGLYIFWWLVFVPRTMAEDEAYCPVTVREFNRVLNTRFDEITGRLDECFERIDQRFERIDQRFGRMDERLDKLEKAQLQRKANKQAAFDGMRKEWGDGHYSLFLYHCLSAYAGDFPDPHTFQRVKGE